MLDWKRLQPLRIPGGWTVMFHKLEDLEPEELLPEDRGWLFLFTQDILYLYIDLEQKRNRCVEKQRLGIDLGWYPDGDPTGCFCLRAVLNGNWERPLLEFTSRSKRDVVEKMEQWLFHEFMPAKYIEEDNFRKNHPVR